MIFEEKGWRVFVDVEKTRQAYSVLKAKNQKGVACECTTCKNVNLNLNRGLLPDDILEACIRFGVSYEIPGEFYVIETSQEAVVYHGFYSLYGEIMEKPEYFDKIWFEEDSSLGTPNFPDHSKIILLGLQVALENFIGKLP